MTTLRTRVATGFAISAAVILGALSTSGAQVLRPVQSATAPNGFPAPRCSRPADQEALRATRLTDFQAELDRRLAEADRKAFVSPAAVRDELRNRSRARKKSSR